MMIVVMILARPADFPCYQAGSDLRSPTAGNVAGGRLLSGGSMRFSHAIVALCGFAGGILVGLVLAAVTDARRPERLDLEGQIAELKASLDSSPAPPVASRESMPALGITVDDLIGGFQSHGFALTESFRGKIDGGERVGLDSADPVAVFSLVASDSNVVSVGIIMFLKPGMSNAESIRVAKFWDAILSTCTPNWGRGADWLNHALDDATAADGETISRTFEGRRVGITRVLRHGMLAFSVEGHSGFNPRKFRP